MLTGGASRLAGLAALAADTLGRPVRLGCPMPIAGLPGRDADPAFATVVGLLPYCVDRTDGRWAPETDTPSMFGAMGRWLRESF